MSPSWFVSKSLNVRSIKMLRSVPLYPRAAWNSLQLRKHRRLISQYPNERLVEMTLDQPKVHGKVLARVDALERKELSIQRADLVDFDC